MRDYVDYQVMNAIFRIDAIARIKLNSLYLEKHTTARRKKLFGQAQDNFFLTWIPYSLVDKCKCLEQLSASIFRVRDGT
jgi:hypothetical protein